ncbi:ATP synthase F1 subunit gamma [Gammaproteobacteria bacterium]|nr:ATP synthase F1 subunit gamma [Gammaproteobacteria bacterium]
MAKTHQIKSVIQSTEKTAVITRAMQLVAASKLPAAKKRQSQAVPFATVIEDMIFGYACDEVLHHPYFQDRDNAHQYGVIIITTDRGLCGNLNLALFKTFLKQQQAWSEQGIEALLSIYGNKGIDFFSGNAQVISSVNHLGDTPPLAKMMSLINPMLRAYKSGQVDRIYIISNTHISTLVQQPTLKQLLPIKPPESVIKHHGSYTYEPSQAEVIPPLLEQYLEASIYRAVIENIACEQAARMISMKNATESAENIIEDLNLTYNKVRQAIITQEIAEISAGSSAD